MNVPEKHHHVHRLDRIHPMGAAQHSQGRFFRLLAENAQDIIYRYQFLPKPGFLYISPAVTHITGFTPADHYAGRHMLTYPQDIPAVVRQGPEQSKETRGILLRWMRQDGRLIWTEHSVTRIYDEAGFLIALEGIARDVTEHQRHERELEAIANVSAGLRQAPGKIEMMWGVLGKVLEITGADGTFVALLDDLSHTQVIQAAQGAFAEKIGQPLPEPPQLIRDRLVMGKPFVPSEITIAEEEQLPTIYEGFKEIAVFPLSIDGETFGVLTVAHKALTHAFTPEEIKLLTTISNLLANSLQRASLVESLQRSNAELWKGYDATIEGWSKALDLRDHETEGHSRRVADMMLQFARAAGMKDTELIYMRWGALLHDIGKMAVPDAILRKPAPLTENEWEIMRLHPIYSYQFMESVNYLRPAIDIPYCHHEKWNGKGYPRGLSGDAIPLSARLFSLIDVWEALTSDRPYRPAWPKENVKTYLRECSGIQFDPWAVDLFFRTFFPA